MNKSTNSIDIKHFIRNLQHTLMVAEHNYNIYWIYKGAETQPIYVDSMNHYIGFFYISMHAHFVACIIALYRLFETRQDSISFTRLLKVLGPEFFTGLPQDFGQRLDRSKAIWIKIAILRNNVFGHQNADSSGLDLFQQARINCDEIKEIIQLSKNLICDISSKYFGQIFSCDLNFEKNDLNSELDTIRMLKDLNILAGKSNDFKTY